jgi:hypothetical protein
MSSVYGERFFFPHGFTRRDEPAAGSVDEIQILDALMRPVSNLLPDVAPVGATLSIRGWAVDPSGPDVRVAASIVVGIGDARYFEVPVRVGRPDVAVALGNHELKESGFMGFVSLAGLRPGRYPLSVSIVPAESAEYFDIPCTRAIEIVSSRYLFPNASEDRSGQIVATITSVEPMRVAPARFARTFTRSDVVVVRGLAYDRGAGTRSAGAYAVVDDHQYVCGVAGLPNPDLQTERSAFVVRIPARDLGLGSHRVRVAALGCDSAKYVESADVEFEVVAAAADRDG